MLSMILAYYSVSTTCTFNPDYVLELCDENQKHNKSGC